MKFRCLGIHGGHVRALLVAAVMVWAFGAYVRDAMQGSPRPGLTGAGLAVTALNVASFALLAAGIGAGGERPGRLHRRVRDAAPWAGDALLLAGMATSLALYGITDADSGGFFLTMVALWVLVSRWPLRRAVPLGMATMATVSAVGMAVGDGRLDTGTYVGFIGVMLGATALRERRAAESETRRAEAAALLLDERTRLAREIHDILAHSLSAQLVHLEGARLLLSRDGDRTQALDRVERAQNLARSGLEETRRALAALRGDAPPPDRALAGLADEYRAATGRDAAVEVVGDPRELSPPAALSVVRTAQEALTNVRKHAPGARVRLTLRYLPGHAELEVVDTGGTEPGLDIAATGSGYGLVGMRERAELIGGTLESGPEGKGYRVKLRLPA
ncbi:sensor histidine kinase [Actinomadura kijaniata]|uniref:sensor histidine kinase n=1 Tax=Actinomadura kijaniata TaxID=46161 RepID=UPI001C3F4269|nr:sensor histidine kinase [Actinomadura kijaniata]